MSAPPRALVVDDDPEMRGILAMMLERGGYAVETAVDGEDGLTRFQRQAFDVVITDHGMPKLSGLELGRACKALAPHIPVFLVTGWDIVLTAPELDHWGLREAFSKPIRSATLLEAIAHARRPAERPDGLAAARRGETPGPGDPAPYKLLVVDADAAALKQLADLLVLDGYTVLTAAGGQEALALAKAERPDLALVDVGAPGIGGATVAQVLRRNPATVSIPLVALTGATGDAADTFPQAGYIGEIARPIDPTDLERLIARFLAATVGRKSARGPA